jgi:hypothetical protein
MWHRADLLWTDVSEASIHTRSKRRHIPQDGIFHSHLCENLRSYKNDCVSILNEIWLSEIKDYLLSLRAEVWYFMDMSKELFLLFRTTLKFQVGDASDGHKTNVKAKLSLCLTN